VTLRAVFFDLDDTLCDTIGCRVERLRMALPALCAVRPELDIDELVRRVMEPLTHPRDVRGLHAVLAELGLLDTPQGMEALSRFATSFEPLCLFPGVAETLAGLGRLYALGIISNSGTFQHAKLVHLGLDQHFRHVIVSSEVGWEKPDPRIFQHALCEAGAAPEEAVFVGDRLDVDIAGAQAAGLRAVWFNHWGGVSAEHNPQPDATIERFELLPAVIAGLRA
jgi:putative hydrolase of the HAD superfamily